MKKTTNRKLHIDRALLRVLSEQRIPAARGGFRGSDICTGTGYTAGPANCNPSDNGTCTNQF